MVGIGRTDGWWWGGSQSVGGGGCSGVRVTLVPLLRPRSDAVKVGTHNDAVYIKC